MMTKEILDLYFEVCQPPQLLKTRLRVSTTNGDQRETVSRRDDVAHPQEPHFRWKKGIKTLCLALLRVKLTELFPAEEKLPIFFGRAGSAAATLDNLVHKADTMFWLQAMLLVQGENEVGRRLQAWFERQNSQGNNKKRPIRIFAGYGAKALAGKNIVVWIGKQEATVEELRELEKGIAYDLGESAWGHHAIFPVLLQAVSQLRPAELAL